jgi:hypothetical protein
MYIAKFNVCFTANLHILKPCGEKAQVHSRAKQPCYWSHYWLLMYMWDPLFLLYHILLSGLMAAYGTLCFFPYLRGGFSNTRVTLQYSSY